MGLGFHVSLVTLIHWANVAPLVSFGQGWAQKLDMDDDKWWTMLTGMNVSWNRKFPKHQMPQKELAKQCQCFKVARKVRGSWRHHWQHLFAAHSWPWAAAQVWLDWRWTRAQGAPGWHTASPGKSAPRYEAMRRADPLVVTNLETENDYWKPYDYWSQIYPMEITSGNNL